MTDQTPSPQTSPPQSADPGFAAPPATTWVPPGGHVPPPPPGWSGGAQWPPRGNTRARVIAVAIAALVVIAAAVAVPLALHNRSAPTTGNNAPSGATTPAPSGDPALAAQAKALYQSALSALRAAAGCHYVATTSGAGTSQKIVGDAGQNTGTQVITLDAAYGSEQFTLVLGSSGTVYFRGNAPALQDQLGVAAAAAPPLQGKWISVVSGDGPYSVLQPGITVSEQAKQLGLTPTAMTSVTTHGTAATRLSGAVPPQQGAPAGTGHLDVANDTKLPVEYVTTISGNGASITSTTTFSAWGTAPSVTVPSGAVAWSTLGASQPPGGYGSGGLGGGTPTQTPLSL